MRCAHVVLLALAMFAILGCDRPRADEGRDALLQVEAAHFFREAMPSSESGPKVLSTTLSAHLTAGTVGQGCSGELDSAANAIAIGLDGDIGFWVLPARIPLSSAPTLPTYEAVFTLAARLVPGTHNLTLRAVDGSGRFGPASVRPLEIAGPARPTGRLVIALSWDDQADLDLHVVLPSGIEIFNRNRTEYQRPPPSAGPVPPNAPTDGGVLDRDSNAACVQDGQRSENVVWTEAPPKGHYIVRVDTSSLCGAPSARWRVEALVDGARIGAAQGTSTDDALRFEHNRGSGVLALELDVP